MAKPAFRRTTSNWSPRVQYLLEEIEADPDALFWG
jgi:hypothetical protein